MRKEFTIDISDKEINHLKRRLSEATLPNEIFLEDSWDLGVKSSSFKKLVDYWLNDYDWKSHEKELNKLNQFHTTISGADIHFIYEKGKSEVSIPLILTHGWPDSFLRYTKLIQELTTPKKINSELEISFDVIIPSVPGFGFSTYSKEISSINNETVADMWYQLMVSELGYDKFIAAGGDIGSGVTRYLAKNYPQNLIGIYLNDVGIIRDLMTKKDDLTEDEINYSKVISNWMNDEAAYMTIQSSKPQTLAYALTDSPIGLAAWIYEKFYSWGDSDSELTMDDILTNIMIYWFSHSFYTSERIYYENSRFLSPIGDIKVPTGMAIFPKDINLPPKEWVEKHYNLIYWSEMPNGGHFTAMENPTAYAKDIFCFTELLIK